MVKTPPDPTRRSEHARRAILEAAIAVVTERGYEGASIEGIAERAGVGKQTIYRWWPSKGAVALEALDDRLASVVSFPDTGNIIEDLRVQMVGVTDLFTTEVGTVYQALIAAAQSDPTLSQDHLDRVINPAVVACKQRFELAKRRGEIRPDLDVQETIDLLYGAIYYRLLLHTRPLDATQIDAALDVVSRGMS